MNYILAAWCYLLKKQPENIRSSCLLYRNNPSYVQNVVILLELGLSSIWWYAHYRSNFGNILLQFKSCRIVSNVGNGCRTCITLFVILISKHNRTSLPFFGTNTIGHSKGIGPVSDSIMSASCKWKNWSSTIPLI